SDQWKEAQNILDAAVEAKRKRLPTDRHQARCSALYVDLNDLGTEWLCPSVIIAEDEAREAINDTVTDYNRDVDRLTNEELHPILEQHQPHLRVKAMSIARSKMSYPVDIPRLRWLDG